MVEGWQTATAMTVDEALEKYTALGVHRFLITSIAQDGMLNGPDLKTLSEAASTQTLKLSRQEESAA